MRRADRFAFAAAKAGLNFVGNLLGLTLLHDQRFMP